MEPRGAPDGPVRERTGPKGDVRRRASYLVDEVSYLEVHRVRIYVRPSAGGPRQRRER
jgi:hypothetical protein